MAYLFAAALFISTARQPSHQNCESDPASCAAKIIRSGNNINITSVGPEGAVFVDGINLVEEIAELRSDIGTLLAYVTALQIADDLIAANVTALQAVDAAARADQNDEAHAQLASTDALIAANVTALQAADAQQAVDAAARADQNDEAHAQLASTDALIAANVTTAQEENGHHSIAISQLRSDNSHLNADVAALNVTTANHAETLVSFDQRIMTNRANSYREHQVVVVHGDPASFYALVLNLPWARTATSPHWGWFKVHRNVQMQRPANWGLNSVDLEATASNTFRGQYPDNLQIDHHLYRGIPSIGNVEYTAHMQSVVVYLRGGGEEGAAYEIDADFAFNAPMFACPTTCAPFGPLMEAGALVFDHDDDAQDVRMGGAYSFPTPLPTINNHQEPDQAAAIANLTATVSRMLVTNVSGVLRFQGTFNALQAGIFPEYANLVEVGGQVQLNRMVGVTDTGPEAFPALTKIGQFGINAHSNADLQVLSGFNALESLGDPSYLGATYSRHVLAISNNPSLRAITGFQHLRKIYGELYIFGNGNITDWSGLRKLECHSGIYASNSPETHCVGCPGWLLNLPECEPPSSPWRVRQEMVVFGNQSWYFPVVLTLPCDGMRHRFRIRRHVSEQAETPRSLDFEASTVCTGWGIRPDVLHVTEYQDHSLSGTSNQVGGLEYTNHGYAVAIWLRGGGDVGTKYHLETDYHISLDDDTKFVPLMEETLVDNRPDDVHDVYVGPREFDNPLQKCAARIQRDGTVATSGMPC